MKRIYLLFLVPFSVCYANPENPTVVHGDVVFDVQQAQELAITASDRAIIHWQDFSIAADEVTRFIQPNSSSVVLNRVIGDIPSNIFGTLEATGKVFLINPAGILIGESGMINTAAFIASTLDLSDHDFMQKRDLFFKGISNASIVNLGTIQTWDGDVVILAKHIDNSGIVTANRGSVLFGAGHEIWLKPTGHEKLYIRPQAQNEADATISSSGEISALQVELKADGNPFAYAINLSGNVDALSITEKQGRVFLVAENSGIKLTGTIATDGSEVKIVADRIALGENGIKNKSGITVQSDLPAELTIQAKTDLKVEDGFSVALQKGKLNLNTSEGDLSIIGTVKLQEAGQLQLSAAQDIKIGSGLQTAHSRVESQHGGLTISAGRDLLISASDNRVAQINAQGDISIVAGRDSILMGGKESTARAFVFSKSNLSFVSGQHLTLDSKGSGYAGVGATNDVTVVVDNAFPVPPQVGPGALNMGPNSRMQGGSLRLFTAKQSNNVIEGVLNLVPFSPGAEYISTSAESWGAYFYSFSGGVPFTIFYKDVWISPRITDQFNAATYEFLQDLKYFDEFTYVQKKFWERYDRKAYEPLRTQDALSSPDVLPDTKYRMLQRNTKNTDSQLEELL